MRCVLLLMLLRQLPPLHCSALGFPPVLSIDRSIDGWIASSPTHVIHTQPPTNPFILISPRQPEQKIPAEAEYRKVIESIATYRLKTAEGIMDVSHSWCILLWLVGWIVL